MRYLFAGMIMTAVICGSCKKTETPRYSGEVVLSSELLLSGSAYDSYGFNYATGRVEILKPGAVADLSVRLNDFADPMETYLESSNFEDAFYLNDTFESATAAEDFFTGYSEVTQPDAGFVPLANNILPNQVWTQKTASGKYAKIWIKEVLIQTGVTTDWIAEVRFQYTFQPDGSKVFLP